MPVIAPVWSAVGCGICCWAASPRISISSPMPARASPQPVSQLPVDRPPLSIGARSVRPGNRRSRHFRASWRGGNGDGPVKRTAKAAASSATTSTATLRKMLGGAISRSTRCITISPISQCSTTWAVSLTSGRLIRLIGDPVQRYHEDPVRMLRAVRFAAKLGFRLDPATEAPLHRLGHLLAQIPPPACPMKFSSCSWAAAPFRPSNCCATIGCSAGCSRPPSDA
jgi:hypothetical protein